MKGSQRRDVVVQLFNCSIGTSPFFRPIGIVQDRSCSPRCTTGDSSKGDTAQWMKKVAGKEVKGWCNNEKEPLTHSFSATVQSP